MAFIAVGIVICLSMALLMVCCCIAAGNADEMAEAEALKTKKDA